MSLTGNRIISPRDDSAVLVQRCRSWLHYPATTPTEAADGHYLVLTGADAVPGVASYDGVTITGGLPDRGYARAVIEADLQRALAGVAAPLRQAGEYSRAAPRAWGWYAAASKHLALTCGPEWNAWLHTPGWACHGTACVLSGRRCTHAIDAVLQECARAMAALLRTEWLR